MNNRAASAAAFALLCCASALAEDELTVRVPAPSSYQMPRGEFRDYAFTYELSNGKRIRFQEYRKQYFAQLDDEARTQLFPLAQGVLVSAAGARIEFNRDGSALTIRGYEKLDTAQLASGASITVLASR